MNPQDDNATDDKSYLVAGHKKRQALQPLSSKDEIIDKRSADDKQPELAAELIRGKIESLYAKEPNAKTEMAEAKAAGSHRSKHQKFMYDLGRSGKSLAEIQTAWHAYYVGLTDNEKHQVWQEFYAQHGRNPTQIFASHAQTKSEAPPKTAPASPEPISHNNAERRTTSDIRKQLLTKVSSRAGQKASRHRSLLFGLSMGTLMMLFMLFGFFNERFIAPFITPSKTVSSTPIILDSTAAVSKDPKIIIPKINVEIPVVYDEESIEESAIQRALEEGVVHYSTTAKPGELGNAAIFGHSSNNILNRGKYKFAFVLLNRLESGDTFMLHYEGKRYIYKVADKKIVPPEDISVLNKTSKPATVSLITCDPPGTAINRLVVIGEQIAPDPAANIASSAENTTSAKPKTLPSNAPSLWHRLTSWLTS